MAKAVGWLERPEERQFNLRRQLMSWYAVLNTDFMAGLSAILERYRAGLAQLAVTKFSGESMSYYWYPWHDRGWAMARAVANGWPDLDGYPEELEALADRWGLRCDWAAPWLHACLIECLYTEFPFSQGLSLIPFRGTNVDLASVFESVRGEDVIRIEVRYKPTPPMVMRDPPQDLATVDWATVDWKRDFVTPRQKAKEKALKKLEEQMDEIDARYVGRDYVRRDKEPELMTHARWLYLRIALKKVPREIALEESVGQDAVEKAIYELARALSLRLPRNRAASVRR